MAEPVWIRADTVIAIHRRQLAEHGGADGIRDEGLLASALVRARNPLAYSRQEADWAALAASYAFGLARNHPFVDGNKRVALVVCRTFLKLNGHDIDTSQAEKYTTFLKLAAGQISEPELAVWIRQRLVKP